jgi:hypothetical protein
VRQQAADAARGAANALRTSTDSARSFRERALAPAPTPAAAAESRAAAAPTLGFTRGFPSASTWPVITRDSATRLLRGPILALPDLPITTVRGTSDLVVVEHVVPPGQIIRLVQRRARADESAGAANERLARYVGDVRVEISGPFAADSLSKLLEKVRVVP